MLWWLRGRILRTRRQIEASDKGTLAEMQVEKWLIKRRFTNVKGHEGKKSALPYDITAQKGKEKWVIDVKTGDKPGIRISNFEKMLQMKGFNKVGFALVPESRPYRIYLLEYKKMSLAGSKAAETRKKNALRKNK
jgi:hypothetical protein